MEDRMKNKETQKHIAKRLVTTMAVLAVITVAVSAGAGMLFNRVPKPPADQFGFGPRTSAQGHYTATIESPAQPLKPRRMLKLQVTIRDAAGAPVDGATIAVDGGMPQHGHGLPTQPRVTRGLGEGRYEIEGLRFNMGGWWELHLDISTPAAGAERVTFNLQV
jgi:hypothetical protein